MLKEAKTHIEKVETKALKPTLRVALQLPPFRSELPMVTVTFHPATDALDKLCDAFEKSLLDWVGKEEDAVTYSRKAKKQVRDLLAIIARVLARGYA